MNAIVPQNFGAVSTRFAGRTVDDDLGAGVQGGFGHIGYKGKSWSIRYRGEERILMRDDGDGPRNSIEIVIVRAPKVISKIFYDAKYAEGSTAAPDCWSTNGLTPDPGAAKKQAPACLGCPKAAWGSRVTDSGKQGKACQDSKRLAVVPLGDLKNELFGGPLLLRVPAASLSDLKTYGDMMRAQGYPYNSIATRVAFDPNEAFPKFAFSGIRRLEDSEADIVLQMYDGPEVARILAEGAEVVQQPVSQAAPQEKLFEQAAQAQAAQPAAQPVQQPVQQPAQQVAKPVAPSTGGFGPMSGGAGAVTAAAQTTATPQAEVATTGVVDFDAQLEKLLA
jgi:hypothetical protein